MSASDRRAGDHVLWRGHKMDATSPAIMESLDSMPYSNRDGLLNPDGAPSPQDHLSLHESPTLHDLPSKSPVWVHHEPRSFLLIDGKENLKVSNAEQFVENLNCTERDLKVKVVSIFGNTGDGKSHTLNQTFFGGHEVFRTSNEQNSCTLGVWAAFDPTLNVICLDTEGLLDSSESAEDILRTRFAQMRLEIEAFSSIKYVGVQTFNSPTNYEPVRSAIKNELNNTTVRSARRPHLVYSTLKVLNDKFSGEIENVSNILFPDQYFTCPVKCLSCMCRCHNSMGHIREGKPHSSDTRCRYQHQYENLVYICKKCHNNGNEVVVTSRTQTQNDNSWYGFAKYAWCGYVIECPHCGEIYRSRQYWYGNKNPEDAAVRTEITHVWNMTNVSMASQITAQRVLDGVSYISEAVSNISLQPTKAVSAWVADQVAPTYWRPNHEIKHCHKCHALFGPADTKHHCRACGEGFCAMCSSHTKCVPSKNWHTPVRVCDICYAKDMNCNEDLNDGNEDVSVRKVTEHVVSTLSAVGTVLTYSKSLVKDTVRPTYWVPDSEVTDCCVCKQKFSDTVPLHHCRDCGRGVCQDCSQHRKPVPRRGWDKPVRVCDSCIKID
ncbi:zinc finger FYVE domain-containing protein 1 isoform X2 [Cephus cinctus]|uniref:Zinc finger FYVE domain-containing protein 1 isoform X2 n=1 Tax=Cephus cinctus TaxID=211228 RepID=A0AAJ7RRF5_CEPCN|nr:zinc finger FYVE domain-containing protein 1 isoform X2 [Cephus cinctus]